MFTINNSINTKNIPSPFQPMSALHFQEQQHLKYLHHMTTKEDTSFPISINDGISEILSCYNQDFIVSITNLDLEDEIVNFNKHSAYKQINFIDWFAFRDYKEDGYIRINNTLRNTESDMIKIYPDIRQLTLSLMHLILIKSKEYNDVDRHLFRGDMRPSSIVDCWNEGDIFLSDTFLSTSNDKNIAFRSCWDQNTLKEGNINVFYEIYNDNSFVGANIIDVLHDGENEFLFLPKTKFIITDKQFYEDEKMMYVKLFTCYSPEVEFYTALHSLIFSSI